VKLLLASPAHRLGLALRLVLAASNAAAQTAPVPNAGSISQQNRQSQQEIEQQSLPQLNGPAVVGPTAPEQLVGPPGGATFLLKSVTFDRSHFIPEAELNEIAARFVGKKIDNSGLQLLVKLVNDIFAKRRIITALAYLPKQDLARGALHVAIIEGRVGKVEIKGNERLPSYWVQSAVRLDPGSVVDVPQVERDVAMFNALRNAQLKASLQPGAQFGLTDIALSVLEPPRDSFQAYIDNMGVDSVGRGEGGLNVQHYGMLGLDDRLTAAVVGSKGDLNGNFGYSLAADPWGGKLGLSAGVGRIRVVSGPYTSLNIHGQSQNEAVNFAQPLYADPNWVFVANAQASREVSVSNSSGLDFTNNITKKATGGATVRFANDTFNITVAPNYAFGHTQFVLTGTSQNFSELTGTEYATVRLPFGFVGVVNGAGQWANQKLLSSDQLFEIGGPTTVRGYVAESAAGYAGFYTNVELHHKLDNIKDNLDVFAFYDHGSVYSTFPAAVSLNSVGAGVSWEVNRYFVADASVGVPVTKTFGVQPDFTAYFRLTARWP